MLIVYSLSLSPYHVTSMRARIFAAHWYIPRPQNSVWHIEALYKHWLNLYPFPPLSSPGSILAPYSQCASSYHTHREQLGLGNQWRLYFRKREERGRKKNGREGGFKFIPYLLIPNNSNLSFRV